MQITVALSHRLLNEFFQNTRFHPVPVVFTGYHVVGDVFINVYIAHYHLQTMKVSNPDRAQKLKVI
jgi:hypothetical protein